LLIFTFSRGWAKIALLFFDRIHRRHRIETGAASRRPHTKNRTLELLTTMPLRLYEIITLIIAKKLGQHRQIIAQLILKKLRQKRQPITRLILKKLKHQGLSITLKIVKK